MKHNVRNRARPEGSIAEGYVANECFIFASRYMRQKKTTAQVPDKERKREKYLRSLLEQIHAYVLENLDMFADYRR